MSEEERGTEKNGETNKSNKKESLKKKKKGKQNIQQPVLAGGSDYLNSCL